MAEKIRENQFDEVGVNPFNAPVPGESLTASPENAKAWERPPQYTNEDKAMEGLYLLLTDQEKLPELIKLIDSGVPIDEIVQVILYQGYTAGQYNPDLMLAMIEPAIYLLIAIADYAEIKDYVLYDGEEDDPDSAIPGDDSTPVNMDDDEETVEEKPKAKPSREGISSSLLSRIKKELPAKVEAVTTEKVEEEIE